MQLRTRILMAVTAAHALVGTLVATAVPGPLLSVDDVAFLSMGRTLAGGGAAPLGEQAPYGVLYPVLLAPGWLLGLDEPQMIVWARVVNALLGAALIPVLYLLVRRLTSAGFGRAVVAAVIGASLPAALLTGSIVWTERLLPLLVALAALCIVRAHDMGSLRTAGVGIAVGVGLYATHPRMGLTALVVFVALATTMWRRDRRAAVLLPAAGVVGIVVAEAARRALADAAFGGTGRYDAADLASRRGLSEIPDMVVHGLGTVAYLVLASAGLAVLGVLVLWRSTTLRGWYLAMAAAVVMVAGWFLTGVGRADAFLHGRYIEVMAPLLVALGVIGARELSSRLAGRLVMGAAIMSGAYGAWAGPGNNWNASLRGRSPVMMLGVEVGGAPFGGDYFEPGAAASVAVVVGLVLIATAHRWRWAPAVVAGAAITLGVFSGIAALDQLYDTSVAGVTEVSLADVEIEHLVVDVERVSPNLVSAVAWEVGLDRVSKEIGIDTTHLLLPPEAAAPSRATLVLELPSGSIWALE